MPPDPRMHARIRPLDRKGKALLDQLEKQRRISPTSRLPDGTRVYDVGNQGVGAFVPDLDKLDPNWRTHLAYDGVNA